VAAASDAAAAAEAGRGGSGREREGGGGGGERGSDSEHDEEEEKEGKGKPPPPPPPPPPRPFVLHVVGASVDAEVAQWPAWLELAALPESGRRGITEVVFVGPSVPVSLHRASAAFSDPPSSSGINIRFARGRYHEFIAAAEGGEAAADAVFAPDAVREVFQEKSSFFPFFFFQTRGGRGRGKTQSRRKTKLTLFSLSPSLSNSFLLFTAGDCRGF